MFSAGEFRGSKLYQPKLSSLGCSVQFRALMLLPQVSVDLFVF